MNAAEAKVSELMDTAKSGGPQKLTKRPVVALLTSSSREVKPAEEPP